MRCIPLNYRLIGDNGTCPNCLVLLADPMVGNSHTVQRTLYRIAGESGHAFWLRAMQAGYELTDTMTYRARVVIFCEYNAAYDPHAEWRDDVENVRRTLRYAMENSTSIVVRTQAAILMADLLYPQLRETSR